MNSTFEKVNFSHLPIIFDWLEQPHMKEFWDTSQEHKEDIYNFVEGRLTPSPYFQGAFTYWMGFMDTQPFSFILTSKVEADESCCATWKEHLSTTGSTYSIDFGIGNRQFLGKKLAAPTLKAFIAFFHAHVDPTADTFFIDPDENNPRAKHVYEKAGFNLVATFIPQEGSFAHKKSYLMVKKM